MKVYVEKLPKNCYECPYCEGILVDAGMNKLSFCKAKKYKMLKDKKLDKTFNKCIVKNEFQTLSDYTKQVRKETITKVYEVLEQAVPHDLCWSWKVIKKELDKIQGDCDEN